MEIRVLPFGLVHVYLSFFDQKSFFKLKMSCTVNARCECDIVNTCQIKDFKCVNTDV